MSGRDGFTNPYADALATGHESWVHPGPGNGLPSIRVQWMAFQGPEFSVLFDTHDARDAAARRLFLAFAPKAERALLGRSRHDLAVAAGHARGSDGYVREMHEIGRRLELAERGEFRVGDRTITPCMVARILGPDVAFSVTPTSQRAGEAFARLGIQATHPRRVRMTGAEILGASAAAARAPLPA